jgi:hypothetical protein
LAAQQETGWRIPALPTLQFVPEAFSSLTIALYQRCREGSTTIRDSLLSNLRVLGGIPDSKHMHDSFRRKKYLVKTSLL